MPISGNDWNSGETRPIGERAVLTYLGRLHPEAASKAEIEAQVESVANEVDHAAVAVGAVDDVLERLIERGEVQSKVIAVGDEEVRYYRKHPEEVTTGTMTG